MMLKAVEPATKTMFLFARMDVTKQFARKVLLRPAFPSKKYNNEL